jgi:hypothetical protein
MQTIERMLSTSPTRANAPGIGDAIAAALECAQACVSCADACLAEPKVADLRRCIRLNQDCADICALTVRVLSRSFEPDAATSRAQLEACILSCGACARECERHAQHHEHCKVCAEACRRCEDRCRALVSHLSAARA